jgi:DNA polymerase-4
LARAALAQHSEEKIISLLATSVSHLEDHFDLQLELPLGVEGEERRPGAKRGMARWEADRAVDAIRDRFGWEAVRYGSAAFGLTRSVLDEFRELAEKELSTVSGCGWFSKSLHRRPPPNSCRLAAAAKSAESG